MSDVKTRKAVVTTAQVQAAIEEYRTVRSELSGAESVAVEFDKGNRGGKAFAVWNGNTMVQEFDTKDEALSFYQNWTFVAKEVVTLIAERKALEVTESAVKAPRKVAAKVVEGSATGDK